MTGTISPSATTLTVNLPSGYSIDTAKLVQASSNIIFNSAGQLYDNGTAYSPLMVRYSSTTAVNPVVLYDNAAGAGLIINANITDTTPITLATNDVIAFMYDVLS